MCRVGPPFTFSSSGPTKLCVHRPKWHLANHWFRRWPIPTHGTLCYLGSSFYWLNISSVTLQSGKHKMRYVLHDEIRKQLDIAFISCNESPNTSPAPSLISNNKDAADLISCTRLTGRYSSLCNVQSHNSACITRKYGRQGLCLFRLCWLSFRLILCLWICANL